VHSQTSAVPCLQNRDPRPFGVFDKGVDMRAVEIESLDVDFPLETPFTVVAAGPIRARIRPRTPSPVNTNEIPRRVQ
jgi:hypothetical protein